MVTHFAKLAAPPAPSLALVNKIVQHLRDQAFLEPLPNRGFRARDYEGLLQAWREAYRLDRHAKRQYFTLLQGRSLQEKLRALDPEGRAASHTLLFPLPISKRPMFASQERGFTYTQASRTSSSRHSKRNSSIQARIWSC